VLDQIDGIVIFEGQDGVKAGTASSELRTWDHGVQGLVEDVERCAAAISENFPVDQLRNPFIFPRVLIPQQELLNEQMAH
jgi:hypothetical protein